ncbi:hypothetical protein K9M47_01300 [Candidatus Gracilibacteria bacterium]|nr:hypothetical protein [Candidatus Gracilibacteria bacterium]MCF7898606.1 hypothetical protein [Candidatus Paceibacterota bacterium]
MSFFISGIFWQIGMFPYIGHSPKIGEVVMIGEAQVEAVFSGMIGNRIIDSRSDGFLHDVYGNSELTDFEIRENNMQFTKCYLRRDDEILYDFEKSEGGVWIGRWHGKRVGEGNAKCILTEIPETFFTQQFPNKK